MGDWKKQLGNVKKRMEAFIRTGEVLERERQKHGISAKGAKAAPTHTPTPAPPRSSSKTPATASRETERRPPRQYPPLSLSLPSEPSWGRPVFNVGIDYGTSMTKVCIRQALGEGDDIPIVPLSLGTSPLCPSVVAIEGGRLYFGEQANGRNQAKAKIFPYLKACLACELERQTPPLAACGLTPTGRPPCHGRFSCGNGANTEVWACDVATLYLAWVMGEARRVVPRSLLGRSSPGFTYNLGVPVDHLDPDSSLLNTYREIGFRAWRLSEKIIQGVRIEHALGWLGALQQVPLPDPGASRVQLCTETGAAIVSCALSPEMASGLYGLVDVGAWTTDISFFRLSDPSSSIHGRHVLAFYGAGTHRIAVNDLDGRSLHGLCELWELPLDLTELAAMNLSPAVLRTQREAGHFGEIVFLINNFKKRPAPAVLDYARACVGERLLRRFHQTLKAASGKEKDARQWEGFLVYVMGGGAHEAAVWSDWAERTPAVGALEPLPLQSLGLNLPEAVQWRFPVAVGLAYPLGMWPKVLLPSQVASGVTLRERRFPNYEELGFGQ